ATGQVLAVGNGETSVTVAAGGGKRTVAIKVTNIAAKPAIGFFEQVMPIIAKSGCNAGACHASQYGKGGFKLSVFGFAPDDDYRARVRDGFGGRVVFLARSQSLFFLKPTRAGPHEGGQRLVAGSVEHRILQQWIAAGAPRPAGNPPQIAALRVF